MINKILNFLKHLPETGDFFTLEDELLGLSKCTDVSSFLLLLCDEKTRVRLPLLNINATIPITEIDKRNEAGY